MKWVQFIRFRAFKIQMRLILTAKYQVFQIKLMKALTRYKMKMLMIIMNQIWKNGEKITEVEITRSPHLAFYKEGKALTALEPT